MDLKSVAILLFIVLEVSSQEPSKAVTYVGPLSSLWKMRRTPRLFYSEDSEEVDIKEIITVLAGAAVLLVGVPFILGIVLLPMFFIVPFLTRMFVNGTGLLPTLGLGTDLNSFPTIPLNTARKLVILLFLFLLKCRVAGTKIFSKNFLILSLKMNAEWIK